MKSALYATHNANGAQMGEVDGWQVPDTFSSVAEEYAAAHSGAVVYDASPMGRLRLTGKTRVDFLHRMSTNDLSALAPGRGVATILTTPNARIIDRLVACARENDVVALTSRGAQELVRRWLTKYIFFNDDVQVRDASGEMSMLSIYGAQATRVVSALAGFAVDDLRRHDWLQVDEASFVVRADAIGGDGYHLVTAPLESTVDLWSKALAAGATPIGERAMEVLRIESGRPIFGRELSEAYIPLEAGLWGDVSFTKGCYVGQEIIARMESRNRLAKQMVGLRAAQPFSAGSDILADEVSVGKVTSAAMRPDGDAVGLGFVKPDYATSGAKVRIGADSLVTAEVIAFQSDRA